MKTPHHTPAPWKVAGLSLNDHEAFVIESDSQTICWTANTLENDEEFVSARDQANALLIAAAPELLAALEVVCEAYKPSYYGSPSPEVAQALAAIAKAKGERIK